jgi:hypothetical protein
MVGARIDPASISASPRFRWWSLSSSPFHMTAIADVASHFRRRRLLSMTLFWFLLKVSPKKL